MIMQKLYFFHESIIHVHRNIGTLSDCSMFFKVVAHEVVASYCALSAAARINKGHDMYR